jgi:hypothetical protein
MEKEISKKETLEEAYDRIFDGKLDRVLKAGFIAGVKLQQERSYSEKEAKQLAFDFYSEMSRAMKVPDYMITDSTILLERKFNQYKK